MGDLLLSYESMRRGPLSIGPGVNESAHPASLGRGLHHETDQAHGGADHPQAQDLQAADRPGQDRHRGLPPHRGDAADLPPLAAAERRDASRGGQAADPAREGERSPQESAGGGRAGESHVQ